MNVTEKLSKKELEELKKLFTNKKVKKNEIIYQKDYNKVAINVIDGILRKYVVKDGKEKTVDLYFPKDLIITPNFNYQSIYSYKIQAIQKSVVSIMDMEAYNQLKNKSTGLLNMDIKVMELVLSQNMYRLETFQLMNATERYLELIKRNAHIIHQVPLIHIASYLGINNASLSKIRASLMRKGEAS